MINGGIFSDDIARLYRERSGVDINDLDRDKFIDAAALAVAENPEQVVRLLEYAIAGRLR